MMSPATSATLWARGFIGAGQTSPNFEGLGSDSTTEVAGGFGFRYMAVKALGMNMGLDFAKGPEDSSIYISFGTKFQ